MADVEHFYTPGFTIKLDKEELELLLTILRKYSNVIVSQRTRETVFASNLADKLYGERTKAHQEKQ